MNVCRIGVLGTGRGKKMMKRCVHQYHDTDKRELIVPNQR